jgi:4'-phosphopantetheinyl transferase
LPSKAPPRMIRVWYSNSGSGSELFPRLLHTLPVALQQHCRSLRSNKRRQQYLQSRLLILTALTQQFGRPFDTWQIEERCHTTPLIHNLPSGYHISLSHSDHFSTFALGTCRLGIDAENMRLDRDFIPAAAMFMNTEELKQLPPELQEIAQYFYRLWCAKEAWFKQLLPIEQNKTVLRNLAYIKLNQAHMPPYLYETQINQYHVAIVSQQPINKHSLTLSEVAP